MEEMMYSYWLANIQGVGAKTIHQMYKYCENAKAIYELNGSQLFHMYGISKQAANLIWESKKKWDLTKEWEKFQESGVEFVSWEQEHYPSRLRELYDPPYALFYIGQLPVQGQKTVGIVGARNCTPYGEYCAKRIGEVLAKNGIAVISGMARGIDSFGHEGALKGNGKTYGVLGCGPNIVYPPENWRVYEQIIQNGGIISEYPPDTSPRPGLFPARNRIISALSDILVVVEAKEKSGSLITADAALEQGKDVYAVPGRITDENSLGCNRLIRQGAGLLLSPEDLIGEIGLFQEKNKLSLEKNESLVYSCLDLHPKSMEEISRQTALDIVTLAELLDSLEEKGYVREVFQNHYISMG